MSSIGTPSVGALNLAGSAAGTQRSGTDTDRVQANSEQARFRVQRDAQASRSLGDVAEAENDPDRDADGRLLHDGRNRRRGSQDGDQAEGRPASPPPDADGERGRALDLQA